MVKTEHKTKEYILESYFSERDYNEINILDIGAKLNYGSIISSDLTNKGCNTFLVNPSQKEFDKLKSFYEINEKVTLFPFAISNNNGMIYIEEKDDSVISDDFVEETINSKYEKTNTIKVMGMDFYAFTITINQDKFNLISINAGGKEYDILNQIDLSNIGCEILIIEYNGKHKDMYINYVTKFGLKLIFDDKKNLMFKMVK